MNIDYRGLLARRERPGECVHTIRTIGNRVVSNCPWDNLVSPCVITKEFVQIESSKLARETLQILGPLVQKSIPVRGIPRESISQLRASDRISEPSATSSETQRSSLTSTSPTCARMRFAWSVHKIDLTVPRAFFAALRTSNCAK